MNIRSVNSKSLVRVETYSDGEAGDITCAIPIDSSGDIDSTRRVIFRGRTILQVPGRPPLYIQFLLPGTSLEEAIAGWLEGVRCALEEIQSQAIKQALLSTGEPPSQHAKDHH